MESIRGIRGAIQVPTNDAHAIEERTIELLTEIATRNALDPEDLIAIWFTQTPDLDAAHAPAAARRLGWVHVPLMGGQEMTVEGQMPRVVRTLVLTRTERDAPTPVHCYLGAAARLREDLANAGEGR